MKKPIINALVYILAIQLFLLIHTFINKTFSDSNVSSSFMELYSSIYLTDLFIPAMIFALIWLSPSFFLKPNSIKNVLLGALCALPLSMISIIILGGGMGWGGPSYNFLLIILSIPISYSIAILPLYFFYKHSL